MLSLLFFTYCVLITTTAMFVSMLLLPFEVLFHKSRSWIHECSRILCMCFWHTPPLWKRRIEGLENVDTTKPYVIVVNHSSMVDIAALYFVKLNFRWVSKREVFRIPYFGFFLMLHGDIAIERGNAATSMHKVLEDGRKWIKRGASVAIFPEGTRSKNGEIHRFKQGAFSLAKEAEVAILPVVVNGTRTALRGWRWNWRNTVSLKVLPPISAEQVAATEMKELIETVQGRMTDALAQMRNRK